MLKINYFTVYSGIYLASNQTEAELEIAATLKLKLRLLSENNMSILLHMWDTNCLVIVSFE